MDGEYRNLANALILRLIHRWSAGLQENGKSEQSFTKKNFPSEDDGVEVKVHRTNAVLHRTVATYKVQCIPKKSYTLYISFGARESAVGLGTALQVGRSRVRFPIV